MKERFERCLDLYLCPRKMKRRLNIDPETLVPRLPKPSELRPYPNSLCIQYLGGLSLTNYWCTYMYIIFNNLFGTVVNYMINIVLSSFFNRYHSPGLPAPLSSIHFTSFLSRFSLSHSHSMSLSVCLPLSVCLSVCLSLLLSVLLSLPLSYSLSLPHSLSLSIPISLSSSASLSQVTKVQFVLFLFRLMVSTWYPVVMMARSDCGRLIHHYVGTYCV